MQRNIPSDRLARVFGVFFALVLGAISLGALVTPQLLSWTSLDTTLWTYGLAIPLIVVLLYPRLRAIDTANAGRVRELAPRIALLETLGIFSTASRTVLERLAGAVQEQSVPAGSQVIREGEAADAFYVLVSGEVRVSARGEGTEEQFLRTMGGGEFFGEIGLLEQVPRTASVVATEPTRLYRIDGDAFLGALSESPASAGFLADAGGRLARTHPSQKLTAKALQAATLEEAG